MRKKLIFLLTIIWILVVCCDQSTFKYYYSNINTINCPILINCKGFQSEKPVNDTKPQLGNRENILKSRFTPKNMDGIVGQIFPSEKSKYVIFASIGDIVYFFLYSYDVNGQRIDSVRLSGYCNNDELIEPHYSTRINDNKLITWIDSTKVFTIDTIANKRIYLLTRIDSGKIKIDESGKFTRLLGNRDF